MKFSRFVIIAIAFAVPALLYTCAGGAEPGSSRSGDGHRGGSLEFEDPDYVQEIDPEILDLLLTWEEAVRTRNHDLLNETIHEEATTFIFQEHNGQVTEFKGLPAIAEFRLEFFRDLGLQEDYRLGLVTNYWFNDEGIGNIGFIFPEQGIEESFGVERIAGHMRFNNISIQLPRPGRFWVTSAYHALTDWNHDGFLTEEERGELMELTMQFAGGPHEVRSPVDEFFDWDESGFIDDMQVTRAMGWFAFHVFPYWYSYIPERGEGDPVYERFDPNRDGLVDDRDFDILHSLMLGSLDGIRPVENPVDEWMDFDGDGDLVFEEIQMRWEEILAYPSEIIFPDALYLPVPREVSNLLDEMADGNGDGMIDENEHEIIIMHSGMNRDVETYFQEAMDRNRNGFIEWYESLLTLQASAMGRGMVAEGAEPPYEVRTPVDRMLDRNRDGLVDNSDIEIVILVFAGDIDLVNEISPELRAGLDWNNDGRIESWEIEESKGQFYYPRPALSDYDFDLELDANSDGFIDPEELGITAGVTNKGEVPAFQERIAIVRRRSGGMPRDDDEPAPFAEFPGTAAPAAGSEYYRKLGVIQDKKLAIVALDVGTEKVDKETANGVIVFVENAFVNIGKVKVVDRGHIEEVFDEFEFQATGVIDESTAVEIGKLSGADIIVIGSINRVGGLFYLNIKLITVENAEIIGSSIAQAQDATGFLEMANQAVYKLF